MLRENGLSEYKTPAQLLARDVSHLTRDGDFWGRDGAIVKARTLFRLQMCGIAIKNGHPLSALSSTLCDAAEHAVAQAITATMSERLGWRILGKFKSLGWKVQAVICLLRALRLSRKLERKYGLENLSNEELNIHATILRKAGRLTDSLKSITVALKRKNVKPESLVLLLIGRAEILISQGKLDLAGFDYHTARMLLPQVSPLIQVRFYRSFAKLFRKELPEIGMEHLETAIRIVMEHGFTDQLEKIVADKILFE